jgi:hypothetical protein
VYITVDYFVESKLTIYDFPFQAHDRDRRLLVDRTAKELYPSPSKWPKIAIAKWWEFREETQTGSGDRRPHQVCRSNDPSGVNMRRLLLLKSSLFVLVFASTVLQCQLAVQTDTGRQVLSRSDLEALPHVKVTASDHSSAPVGFEGVTLKSVLEKAGVTIALPELDPAFTDKTIVLALLEMGNRSMKRKAHIALSSLMKKGWPVGSSR